MRAPPVVANAARERVKKCADEIRHSLRAISQGRPAEAETDRTRRTAVVQVRSRVSFAEARRIQAAGPEAVWGETIDFVDVSFLERGMLAARSICRIATRAGQGFGTGFLISPRLLITNNHVIGSAIAARGAVAEFDFERDLAGVPREVTRFELAPEVAFLTDERDDLDFTVVAVGPRLAGPRDLAAFGFLPLSGARNKHQLGDFVNLIQHPDGRMKEAVVRENRLVSRPKSGTVLHYVADSEPGSSGSPVFNVMWEVVALHHWGGPHRELFDEHGVRVPRTVNEGVRSSAIVLDLETRKSALSGTARSLIDEALMLGIELRPGLDGSRDGAVAVDRAQGYDGGLAGPAVTLADDGTATWQIPLSVSVRLGGVPAAPRTSGAAARPSAPSVTAPGDASGIVGEARLEVDEDYSNRGGYDPLFLGTPIPLPALSPELSEVAAVNQQAASDDEPHELKYEHFSVVMHGERRLAFFTATNIDGSQAKDVNRRTGEITDASGDTEDEEELSEASEVWFLDPRIEEDEQTPPKFFSGQTSFDADGNPILNRRTSAHSNRIFQQGHLTRRQDPLWGPDEVVIRAHADTFHVTNRSPQVGYFNMGVFKPAEESGHPGGTLHWRALEDFVLNNARADRQRVTVFTGPIFDEDNDIPWSRGREDMEGFLAPLEYWKLLLRMEQGELHATAFVADQSPLIDFVPEMMEVSPEAANRIAFEKVVRYHVSVAELSDRTGLDFGPDVLAADTFRPGPGEEARIRLVRTIAELSFDRPSKDRAARRMRPTSDGRAAATKSRRKAAKRGRK